jgi:hypothetical protein
MEPLSGSLDTTIFPMKPQLAAVRQMLVGAVSAGLLPADHSGNYLAAVGWFGKSTVSRKALQEFADARKLKPAFLYRESASSPLAESAPTQEVSKVTQGRKPRDYRYPSDTPIIQRLAAAFENDAKLDELSALLIVDAASAVGAAAQTERERDKLVGRIRHRFEKDYPGLYARCGGRRRTGS